MNLLNGCTAEICLAKLKILFSIKFNNGYEIQFDSYIVSVLSSFGIVDVLHMSGFKYILKSAKSHTKNPILKSIKKTILQRE